MSSEWLQRREATYVRINRKGEARVFLRHSNAGLANRHNLDHTLPTDIPECSP